MSTALIELHYLPSISWFTAVKKCDNIILEAHENFQKQSYRNRCYINTSQGPIALVVPLTGKSGNVNIREVEIDHSQAWLNVHWRSIKSAYGKAPFYEYYADDLHDTLFRKSDRLYDLNRALLTMCLKWLKWDVVVEESSTFEKSIELPLLDLRSALSPKKTEELPTFYQPAVYHQVFGNKFVQNLSLIDLIFCEGPGAWAVIQASIPK